MSNLNPEEEIGTRPENMPRDTGRLRLLICFALFFGTLALYAPVRHYDFVNYDDDDYVARNLHVLGGFTPHNVAWAFTRFHAGNWHPLTWLSHMFDVQLWGLNPGAFHTGNAILHAANAVLLFLVFFKMTGSRWSSAFIAAVFAWHPLHVESVAWISERKDVLSAFFWILTLGAYQHYVRQPQARRYFLVLGLFACGLMSKPMVVTLPFVLLLLDYWPLRRAQWTRKDAAKWLKLFVEKIPLLLLVVISCVVTNQSQRSFGVIKSVAEEPWPLRISNVVLSYLGYLSKTVCPVHLSVFYPLPSSSPLARTAIASLLLIGITALVVSKARPYPSILVGWGWFVGTLVPVIGLIQVGVQSMADRYMYLPLIGLSIIAAWGIPRLFENRCGNIPVLATAAVTSLVLCVVASARQLTYWRDSISLYSHAFAISAKDGTAGNMAPPPMLFDGLADAFLRAGRVPEADAIVTDARRQFPENGKRLNLAGLIKAQMNQSTEAEALWKRAVQLDPEWYQTYNNLGILYTNQGQLKMARVNFERLVELRPDDVIALGNLAQLYLVEKDYERARRCCERGLAIAPNDEVLRNLAAKIGK